MSKDVRTNMNANGILIEPKYTKKAIVYEATRAMGEGTNDMMKKVMLKLRKVHSLGIPTPSGVWRLSLGTPTGVLQISLDSEVRDPSINKLTTVTCNSQS